MKQQFKRAFLICAATAICCGGCAKHELVKQDQMVPTLTPSVSLPPAKSTVPAEVKQKEPAQANHALEDTSLAGSSIKESQAEGQALQGTATQAGKDAALQPALDKVFFDFNSCKLSPSAIETLAKNAAILQQKKNVKIRIEGHCDELGSDDYNLSLGESRAKSALNYLHSMGIPLERLSVISYGKEKPADPGHDEAARARNRRDELVVISK